MTTVFWKVYYVCSRCWKLEEGYGSRLLSDESDRYHILGGICDMLRHETKRLISYREAGLLGEEDLHEKIELLYTDMQAWYESEMEKLEQRHSLPQ